MKNGGRKGQFLFPAQRQRTDQFAGFAFQPKRLEHGFHTGFYFLHSQAVNSAVKFYIFAYRQIFIHRKLLAHISDVLLNIFLLSVHIKSGYECLAAGRVRQTAKHTHGSGFSGSVGAQKTENFALFYFE